MELNPNRLRVGGSVEEEEVSMPTHFHVTLRKLSPRGVKGIQSHCIVSNSFYISWVSMSLQNLHWVISHFGKRVGFSLVTCLSTLSFVHVNKTTCHWGVSVLESTYWRSFVVTDPVPVRGLYEILLPVSPLVLDTLDWCSYTLRYYTFYYSLT